MSKLRPEHLAPLAEALRQALREGAITPEQAFDFCDATFNAYLDHRIENPYVARAVANFKRTSKGKSHGETNES